MDRRSSRLKRPTPDRRADRPRRLRRPRRAGWPGLPRAWRPRTERPRKARGEPARPKKAPSFPSYTNCGRHVRRLATRASAHWRRDGGGPQTAAARSTEKAAEKGCGEPAPRTQTTWACPPATSLPRATRPHPATSPDLDAKLHGSSDGQDVPGATAKKNGPTLQQAKRSLQPWQPRAVQRREGTGLGVRQSKCCWQKLAKASSTGRGKSSWQRASSTDATKSQQPAAQIPGLHPRKCCWQKQQN